MSDRYHIYSLPRKQYYPFDSSCLMCSGHIVIQTLLNLAGLSVMFCEILHSSNVFGALEEGFSRIQ